MARARTRIQQATGPVKSHTAKFDPKAVKPPDPTKGTPTEPAIPGRLGEYAPTAWTLHTVGGTMVFAATADGKVTGGVPTLVLTEIDGREPATSLGDKPGKSATLEIICTGRMAGLVVEPYVHALFQAAEAGRLVRVYGPFDRPGMGGKVWKLGEPTFTDSARNSTNQLNHAMLTVPLEGWAPADRVGIGAAVDPVKAARDKQRLSKARAKQDKKKKRTQGIWG